MISNGTVYTAFLYQSINIAGYAAHTGPVVMNWNVMLGGGDSKTLRYRFMAHGSGVPISWGRLPDKIDR